MPNTEEGMMMWRGLSLNGLLGSYFFDGTVTGSTYRQVLVDYAWPQLQRKKLYFQHDRVAPHYAVIVREWFNEKSPSRWIGRCGPFDWPAPSPDLTPCDLFSLGISKGCCIQGTLYLNYATSQQNSESLCRNN